MLQAGQARWILGLNPRLGITNEAHLPWILMVEPYWSVVDIPVRWPVIFGDLACANEILYMYTVA